MEGINWSDYYKLSASKPPHEILSKLDLYLPETGHCLDLGCGVGNGTGFLLERGLSVLAVDADAEAVQIVGHRFPHAEAKRSTFQDLELDANSFDVVIALFSLFFLPPEAHQIFWAKVVASMKPGSLFAGQFLGPDDDWVSRGYAFHNRDALEGLFQGFQLLDLEEANRDGSTLQGEHKHWHVFHVVAKKGATESPLRLT
jgi:trans-aconitate methyltransferase